MAHVRLADQHVAESLTQSTALPGDILVADRGYCKPPAVKRTLESGVELVVRLHWAGFPLYHQDGSRFDLLEWVRTLPPPPTECRVFLTAQSQHPIRLLAVRLELCSCTA